MSNPNPRYVVDGHEFPPDSPELLGENGYPNNESSFLGDGEFPPFGIFDIEAQDYLTPFYPTREAAEAALVKLQPVSVIALLAFVETIAAGNTEIDELESQARAILSQAIVGAGFYVSGPTDSRAAEHGEPAWVCNARAAIAKGR